MRGSFDFVAQQTLQDIYHWPIKAGICCVPLVTQAFKRPDFDWGQQQRLNTSTGTN